MQDLAVVLNALAAKAGPSARIALVYDTSSGLDEAWRLSVIGGVSDFDGVRVEHTPEDAVRGYLNDIRKNLRVKTSDVNTMMSGADSKPIAR